MREAVRLCREAANLGDPEAFWALAGDTCWVKASRKAQRAQSFYGHALHNLAMRPRMNN
jgi:hypothetical protein